MKLSILICTTIDRRHLFEPLYFELQNQSLNKPVEVLYIEDNKEISVGLKRQRLLEKATGEYIVYFDSDDQPAPFYVEKILEALESGPDCVGIEIQMTTNGLKPQSCCHSLRFPIWEDNVGGYDYVRNVTHFNPVKRELALKVGFSDIRFGEDKEYSDKLTPLCKTEVFIDVPIFHYRYTTHENFLEKYGFKD